MTEGPISSLARSLGNYKDLEVLSGCESYSGSSSPPSARPTAKHFCECLSLRLARYNINLKTKGGEHCQGLIYRVLKDKLGQVESGVRFLIYD